MEKRIFDKFREIIYQTSGIKLNDNKEALVGARIAKRMRHLGMSDHAQYLHHVLHDESGEEIVQLLDAVSTNVTHFFREPAHFEFLADALRQWTAAKQRVFRFWSAGCSSGEEPYSIAMTILESIGDARPDARILATDISTRVLARCVEAVYEQKKVESVPPLLRERYFVPVAGAKEACRQVRDDVRRLIVFRRLNLSVTPYPMRGPMDAIFCRNVMIYFDNDVRRRLLAEFVRLLKPEGYLFVGHAESLTGILSGLRAVAPSVYVKQ